MGEWQDISTAPKGVIIIVHSACHPEDYDTSVAGAFWGTIDAYGDDPREGWCNWWEGIDDQGIWSEVTGVTHWMPLPPLPKAEVIYEPEGEG